MGEGIIHVLEDMNYRVDWLKERFPKAEIVWSTNVKAFFERLTKEVSLIILDHDLGEDGSGYGSDSPDRNGQTGADVAKQLEASCPVLVWSSNAVAGPKMALTLQDKGIKAVHIPFYEHHQPAIEKLIGAALDERKQDTVKDVE